METNKRINRRLLFVLGLGFFNVLIGSYLKILHAEKASLFLAVGLFFEIVALLGFIINNFSRIKKAAF